MYKLLIADDEPRQVKALANIISKLKPEYEVFTAEDGQKALEILLQTKIDILLTDIKMPVMDGLELIAKLSEREHKIKIVILSGYGEFEYAQKAIHFGVHDYLVKPISKENLHELLSNMETSIKEDHEQAQYQESLKKNLENSLPVYIEHQLNQWVRENLDEKGIREIASIFPFKGCGAVLITSLSSVSKDSKFYDSEKFKDFIQHLKYLIKETLKPFGHTISFTLEGYTCMVVSVLNADRAFHLSSFESMKRFNEYIATIKNEFGMSATIGLSEKSGYIFNDIGKCFREALAAVERKFYVGLGRVIYFAELKNNSYEDIYLNAIEIELSDAVHRMDKNSVIKITGKIFKMTEEHCSFEPQRLKEEWLHLVLNQIKLLYPMMIDEEYSAFIKETKDRIIYCEEYKELWHCVNSIISDVIDLRSHKGSSISSVIIDKCKKYMDENYMKELSLESIAQKFYFNPSYFSNLFKSSMGIGFSEYLNRIRVENAQKLLKCSDSKMADVASKVGFNDPTYFNRVFKRQTGFSPLAYRKMNGK